MLTKGELGLEGEVFSENRNGRTDSVFETIPGVVSDAGRLFMDNSDVEFGFGGFAALGSRFRIEMLLVRSRIPFFNVDILLAIRIGMGD